MLRPTLDPIEQINQLELLAQRRQNSTADIEIRLRANNDTSHLRRFYNGNVTIYPDIDADTALYIPQIKTSKGYKIITYYDRFKPHIIAENIYLQKGELYRQRNYLKTLNRFNSLSSWRLVNIIQTPRPDEDTVDFIIQLTPANKYGFSANLEASRNIGRAFVQGSLFGLGVNLGLQNRNFARAANEASTNFRFGTELGGTQNRGLIQTIQSSLSHTITFPRSVPKFIFPRGEKRDNAKTFLNFNIGNIDRIDYFNVTSLNTSFGWETNWKNKLVTFRFPNVEYNFLKRRKLLDTLIERNASYKYIFNNGLISSILGNISIAGNRKNVTNLKRFGVEIPNPITAFIRTKFFDDNLYRFVKLDAEYRQTQIIRRTELAWRVFGGIGIGLPKTMENRKDSLNFYLPFFRQYYAGGSNSMRAWGLRKLGPGSRIASFARNIAPDRFGDVQLEANLEYRFF